MQEQSNNGATTAETADMYVIFRVFNLGKKDCGVSVFVDPEQLRQAGQLVFTEGPWGVVAK